MAHLCLLGNVCLSYHPGESIGSEYNYGLCFFFFFFLKTLSFLVLCPFSVEVSSAAFDHWSRPDIYTNDIFQQWPQNQHKATIRPPKIDVVSLIHFPELVREQDLTGNPGSLFLDFLRAAILFVGTLDLTGSALGWPAAVHTPGLSQQHPASLPSPPPHLAVLEWIRINVIYILPALAGNSTRLTWVPSAGLIIFYLFLRKLRL